MSRPFAVQEALDDMADADLEPVEGYIESLEAKVLALTTAAAPLIDWLTKLEVEFSKTDDNVIAGGIRGISITFGDLRKLRAALEQASKAGGGAP